MFPLTDPGPLRLNPIVKDFFSNWIRIQNEVYQFPYRNHREESAREYWSPGMHLVPVTSGIWLVNEGFPAQVRHLFLSHSAADILCFCQLRPEWLKVPGNVAFAALGLLPTTCQVGFLKESFANAKMHTLFDKGLTGRVTDCKVALWRAEKDANFTVIDDLVHINYRRSKFSISAAVFSLNRFEKAVALRSGIHTHKPKGGFSSYHEFFVNTHY